MNYTATKISNIKRLKQMWNCELNKDLNMDFFNTEETGLLWWRCDSGHSFLRSPKEMLTSQQCPKCTSFKKITFKARNIGVTHPHIAKLFHEELNSPLCVEHITPGSNRRLWWTCEKGHPDFHALVLSMTKGKTGCPICMKKDKMKDVCVPNKYPELMKDWDHELNKDLDPYIISYGSSLMVNWKCHDCNHKWPTVVNSRTISKTGCPACFKKRHSIHMSQRDLFPKNNSILKKYPNLCEIWDYKLNNPIKPEHLTEYSQRLVYWKCPLCSNSFQDRVVRMTHIKVAKLCPVCHEKMY